MNITDPEFLPSLDAAIRSTTFSKSQVLELEEALEQRARFKHTHSIIEIDHLDDLIEEHLRNCKVSINQVAGLNDVIDSAMSVREEIRHIVPEAQGSYIPIRVLTIEIPPATVSFLRLQVIGYDVNTGDTYSTTIEATLRNFNGSVSTVGDAKSTPVFDAGVHRWKAALVPDSRKNGITVLVCSDSGKRVVWKIVANVL